MGEIKVVIEQIFLLFIIGLTGILAGRFKYLPANSDKVISSLVVKITAPLMIFTKIYNDMEFDADDYSNGIKLYFFAIIFILTGYGISLLLRRVCKVEGATAKIFSMQMMFGNVVYFALPLIAVLSSQMPEIWGKGVAYAMFFILGNDTLMWTLGISLLSNKEGDTAKSRIKHLLNANTLAFLIGLMFLITGAKGTVSQVHLLNIFIEKLTEIGAMTAHLSMLFIGLMLSRLKISAILKDFKNKYLLLVSSGVKLLLLPLASIIILKLLGGFLPPEPAKVLVIQLAMSGGTLVAALAGQYESDAEFAAEGVFVSTTLLVITLPLVLWVSNMVLS